MMKWKKQYEETLMDAGFQGDCDVFCRNKTDRYYQVQEKELDDKIFKRDKAGNILYTKLGLPRINWISLLWNLGEIVARYLILRMLERRTPK